MSQATRRRTDPEKGNYIQAAASFFPVVSKSDIHNTVPRLKTEFCALWNEVYSKSK